MKTAMQELLEEVISERESSINVDFREALDFVKSAIEQDYLDKEKEQMIDWYATGQADTVNMYEQHLNKTFNTNEK
jgi:hypothetical protein